MLSRLGGTALGIGLVVLAGCAGNQVSTDYSPAAGFSQYRTFSMVSRPDSVSHQLIDDRVRNSVEARLEGKGLKETDRSSADLFVGYGVVDRTHKEIYTTGPGWGWGGGWGWRSYRWGMAWPTDLRRSVETYTDGTVMICLVDAKTHRLVWQGQADDALSLPVNDPAKATRSIDEAVASILAKYPPSSKT
jgi:uncharacterized protein DUF4136